MKICKKCNISKLETEYYSYKYSKDKLRYNCKNCCIKIQKERRQSNPEKQQEYTDKWVKNNYTRYREQINNHFNNRYNNDPLFKLQHNLRLRLRQSLKIKRWNKNNNFKNYIGCSPQFLVNHIESQFKLKMTWDNYGKWHIDHIIPLNSAKTEEELYKLCHYTNLQPLWAAENIRKKDKVA